MESQAAQGSHRTRNHRVSRLREAENKQARKSNSGTTDDDRPPPGGLTASTQSQSVGVARHSAVPFPSISTSSRQAYVTWAGRRGGQSPARRIRPSRRPDVQTPFVPRDQVERIVPDNLPPVR